MRALVAWLALAAAGCGIEGITCGRGRCAAGQTCLSIFGDGRKNQGWSEERAPNVLHEWWCLRPCPGGKSCASGECLEDPADSDTVVCATDRVDVEYESAGKSCLCDPKSTTCYQDQSVTGYQILDGCTSSGTVRQSCVPNTPCQAGTFHAGDAVPGVHEISSASGYEHSYCLGQPNNTFGSRLPEGAKVRIYADTDACP